MALMFSVTLAPYRLGRTLFGMNSHPQLESRQDSMRTIMPVFQSFAYKV